MHNASSMILTAGQDEVPRAPCVRICRDAISVHGHASWRTDWENCHHHRLIDWYKLYWWFIGTKYDKLYWWLVSTNCIDDWLVQNISNIDRCTLFGILWYNDPRNSNRWNIKKLLQLRVWKMRLLGARGGRDNVTFDKNEWSFVYSREYISRKIKLKQCCFLHSLVYVLLKVFLYQDLIYV